MTDINLQFGKHEHVTWPHKRRYSRRHRRRGAALYVAVMFTALLVSLLGLSGLTLVRVERERASRSMDQLVTLRNSRSAVELALQVISTDSDWRNTFSNGVETNKQFLGSPEHGTVSWVLEDTDGRLDDADTDLRLKGVGRLGNTVQVSSIGVTASGEPLSCLEVAVCVGDDASFSSSSIVSTNQTLHSNNSVSNSGTVNSDVEAVGPISGSGYNGTTTSPVPTRVVPSSSVFDYYINNGTAIAYTDLPKAGPARTIMDVVLSPNSNPFGPTDPQGIYVIDCQGDMLRIKFSRIVGTLVLLNLNPFSDIEDNLSMEPAIPNYPALLVQGGVEFRLQNIALSESDRGVNFNPPGTPYLGSTDTDIVDTYPTQIKGLVYISDTAEVRLNDTVIDGVLVVGNQLILTIGETLTVTYDSQFFSNPPPGFFTGDKLVVTPGSWRRDAAPSP